MSLADVRELALDRRDHLVISLIDGRCTVEAIGEVAGLDAHQAIRVIAKLFRLGAVELCEP